MVGMLVINRDLIEILVKNRVEHPVLGFNQEISERIWLKSSDFFRIRFSPVHPKNMWVVSGGYYGFQPDNLVKNCRFGQKSKVWLKIDLFLRSDLFLRNWNFGQNLNIRQKYKYGLHIFVRNQNFGQKYKYGLHIFVRNQNFGQK